MSHLADLYLLGTGLCASRHLTSETRAALERCRIVLHLTGENQLLRRLNPNVHDLGSEYWQKGDWNESFQRLVNRVMEEVKHGPGVASVIYGHPLFFDDVHAELRCQAQRCGYSCVVLPAVSSLDTISIDLGIDYGEGLQVFEATDLVENSLSLNVYLHTLIFQVGEFGTSVTPDAIFVECGRLLRLQRYLEQYFPSEHYVTAVYSADGRQEERFRMKLKNIERNRRRLFPGVTLYVPPIS